MIEHIDIRDRFFPQARAMREFFDKRFINPKRPSEDRFVWDNWYVEDQYSVIRTPAARFFPQSILKPFYEKLLEYGRENLGCAGISPPWVSYYVEGCFQDLHTDVPHGPWAYVYSLTDWEQRVFEGGETLILNEDILNYWNRVSGWAGLEKKEIFTRVEPKFNRLSVFDPRLPHGVARVSGTRDPLKARLVVHGWFTEPQPFVEGGLSRKQFMEGFAPVEKRIAQAVAEVEHLHGTLSLRFQVSPSGKISKPRVLTENLRPFGADRENLLVAVDEALGRVRFPSAKKSTRVTLPLLFRNES